MNPRYARLLGAAIPVALLDQAVKFVVVAKIPLGQGIDVLPGFFNLVHVLNRGAAFGMLNRGDISWQRWVFLGIALTAMVVIWLMARYSRPEEKLLHYGLGCIFGGALGNCIDRLHTGMVIDFLDFYLGDLHWPAFNVADSAITVGAVLMIFSFYRKGGAKSREQR